MILCADDYGLRDDIDSAILELVASHKISAVSCMVVFERCSRTCLAELLNFRDQIDVGLHLCLTDEGLALSETSSVQPGQFPPFSALLKSALRGQIEPQQVVRQISLQYALFYQKCGRHPDFVDGHLHAHQLPGIREGLLSFVSSLPTDDRPYIRNTKMSWLDIWWHRLPWLKTMAIGFFGSRLFVQLGRQGILTNDGFAGIYDFRNWRKYSRYLPRFMACLHQPNGLLVVHPGQEEAWRQQEFRTLGEFVFTDGTPNRFRR
jgi:hypothetical protein